MWRPAASPCSVCSVVPWGREPRFCGGFGLLALRLMELSDAEDDARPSRATLACLAQFAAAGAPERARQRVVSRVARPQGGRGDDARRVRAFSRSPSLRACARATRRCSRTCRPRRPTPAAARRAAARRAPSRRPLRSARAPRDSRHGRGRAARRARGPSSRASARRSRRAPRRCGASATSSRARLEESERLPPPPPRRRRPDETGGRAPQSGDAQTQTDAPAPAPAPVPALFRGDCGAAPARAPPRIARHISRAPPPPPPPPPRIAHLTPPRRGVVDADRRRVKAKPPTPSAAKPAAHASARPASGTAAAMAADARRGEHADLPPIAARQGMPATMRPPPVDTSAPPPPPAVRATTTAVRSPTARASPAAPCALTPTAKEGTPPSSAFQRPTDAHEGLDVAFEWGDHAGGAPVDAASDITVTDSVGHASSTTSDLDIDIDFEWNHGTAAAASGRVRRARAGSKRRARGAHTGKGQRSPEERGAPRCAGAVLAERGASEVKRSEVHGVGTRRAGLSGRLKGQARLMVATLVDATRSPPGFP